MGRVTPAKLATFIALSGTALVAAAAVCSTFLWGNHEALALYFLLILLVSVATQWRARPGADEPDPRYWFAPLLLLTALGAYLRLKGIGGELVWSDEDNHNGLVLLRSDTVNVAAWSQQPPIFYYLSLLGRKLLGNDAFGLRFFSTLLGALAVPVFYLFLLRLCRNIFLAFAGGLALAVNPWAVSYSIEAKPYACGMFFSVVFLHFTWEFYREQRLWRALAWLLSALLFLLSIGFQPVVFVAAMGLGLLLFLPEKKPPALAVFAGALALTGLLFLPFLLNAMANAHGFLRTTGSLSGLQIRLGVDPRFFSLMGALSFLLWAAVLPLLLFFTGERSPRARFQAAMVVAALAFPLLFTTIYHALVDYLLRPRHMITYLPIVITAITCGLGAIHDRITRRFGSGTFWQGVVTGLALLYAFGSAGVSERAVEYKWLAAYDYLREHGRPGDEAFYFTLSPPGHFTADGFLLTDYYYTPEIRAKVKLQSRWEIMKEEGGVVSTILDSLASGSNPAQIFLFHENGQSAVNFSALSYRRTPVTIDFLQKRGVDAWPFGGTMLTLDAREGKLRAWKGFLEDVDAQERRPEVKSRVYELLAGIAIFQGQCARAAGLLRQLGSTPIYAHVVPNNMTKLTRLLSERCPSTPE